MDEYEQAMQKASTKDMRRVLLSNIRALGNAVPLLILSVGLMTPDQIEALFRKIPEMDSAINSANFTYGEVALISVLTINAAMKDLI